MTQLTFEARLAGVKVAVPKRASEGWGPDKHDVLEGGTLELTIAVQRPSATPRPRMPWQLEDAAVVKNPRRQKGETDEDYAERLEAAAAERDELREIAIEHEAELAAWELANSDLPDALRAYMQLTGLAALFGNMRCRVTIEPIETDLLPGFAPSLLGGPQ